MTLLLIIILFILILVIFSNRKDNITHSKYCCFNNKTSALTLFLSGIGLGFIIDKFINSDKEDMMNLDDEYNEEEYFDNLEDDSYLDDEVNEDYNEYDDY